MTQHSRDTPQFYLTAPSPCPYLPGRHERKVFTHLVGDKAGELNDLLTHGGFRRSQSIAYRPACDQCRACVSVRVIANEFRKRNEKSIKYVGLNNFPVILDAIKDGYATGTMAQNPYGQAYLASYSLKLLTDGCTYKGTDFYINTGLLYITKDSLATQADDLAKVTSGLAKDWKAKYFNCPG